MSPGGPIKILAFGALLTLAVAWSCQPPAAAAEGAKDEPLRGGIQVRHGGASGIQAQNPGAAYPAPKKKRTPASGPGDDLRTQGDLRRDTFRLLLGGR